MYSPMEESKMSSWKKQTWMRSSLWIHLLATGNTGDKKGFNDTWGHTCIQQNPECGKAGGRNKPVHPQMNTTRREEEEDPPERLQLQRHISQGSVWTLFGCWFWVQLLKTTLRQRGKWGMTGSLVKSHVTEQPSCADTVFWGLFPCDRMES